MNEKISHATSYAISAGGASYWFFSLLHHFTPEEWAAVGVLGNLFLGSLTFCVWLVFKIRAYRRGR